MAIDPAVLSQLITDAGGIDNAVELIKKQKLATVREKFAGRVAGVATLTVANWDAVDAFRHAPATGESAPSLIFEEILADIEAAIEARNAAALITNLLLAWKAVRRAR